MLRFEVHSKHDGIYERLGLPLYKCDGGGRMILTVLAPRYRGRLRELDLIGEARHHMASIAHHLLPMRYNSRRYLGTKVRELLIRRLESKMSGKLLVVVTSKYVVE